MKLEEQAIIIILKAFLNDSVADISDDISFDRFNHLTRINSISGVVGYVLQQVSKGTIPLEIREKYESEFLSTIAITTMHDEDMKSLIALLNKNGIDHLLFKGYIVKNLYTVPELRTYGDIDFAISPSSRDRCDSLMRENGYRLLDNWEPVYSYDKDMQHYEIHTELIDSNLNDRADYQAYFKDFWKHTLKIDEHSFVLDPEFHLLYLLVHIAKHLYGSGAGIRMYLDIAFYLREYRESIDWTHFCQEIEKLQLTKFVNTVFSAVEEWFAIKSPIPLKKVDPDFMERFLTFTLNGGVFGFEDKSSALTQLRKNASDRSVNRTVALLSRAFPPVKHMEARYTYLQTKPWLLPAAWIHRLFKKKGTTADYIKESKELLTVNNDKVVELNELYKKIGV